MEPDSSRSFSMTLSVRLHLLRGLVRLGSVGVAPARVPLLENVPAAASLGVRGKGSRR